MSIEGGGRPTEVRGSAAFHVVAYEQDGDLDSVASFGRGRDASALIASGGGTTVISGYQRNVAGPLVINGTTLIAREQMGYPARYLARLAPPDTGRSVREFTGTGGFLTLPFVAPDGTIFAGGSFDGTVELGARTLRAGAVSWFVGFGDSNVFVSHVVVDEARRLVHAAARIVNDTTIDGRLYTFRGGTRVTDDDIVVISFDAAAGTITRVEAIAGTGGDLVRDMRVMPDGRILLGGHVNDGATGSDYPTLLGPVISTSLTGFVYLMP